MEHSTPANGGYFIALAKGNWKSETRKDYTIRDNNSKGTVDIQIFKLSNQSLVKIFQKKIEIF